MHKGLNFEVIQYKHTAHRHTNQKTQEKHKQRNVKKIRSSEHLKFTISRYRKIYVELRGDIYKFMRLLLAQCVRAFRVSSFSLLWQILQTDLYEGSIHPPYTYEAFFA